MQPLHALRGRETRRLMYTILAGKMLGSVALVATVIPAARAARTDPLEALRAE